MISSLNPVEQTIVRMVADMRARHAKINGTPTTIYKEHKSRVAELIQSYGGEMAFCKMFNAFPDFTVGSFLPYDAILASSQTVDIKTTHAKNGRLIVKVKPRKNPPDLYALMVGSFPTYEFRGYAKSISVLRQDTIDKSIRYPAHILTQDQLLMRGL